MLMVFDNQKPFRTTLLPCLNNFKKCLYANNSQLTCIGLKTNILT